MSCKWDSLRSDIQWSLRACSCPCSKMPEFQVPCAVLLTPQPNAWTKCRKRVPFCSSTGSCWVKKVKLLLLEVPQHAAVIRLPPLPSGNSGGCCTSTAACEKHTRMCQRCALPRSSQFVELRWFHYSESAWLLLGGPRQIGKSLPTLTSTFASCRHTPTTIETVKPKDLEPVGPLFLAFNTFQASKTISFTLYKDQTGSEEVFSEVFPQAINPSFHVIWERCSSAQSSTCLHPWVLRLGGRARNRKSLTLNKKLGTLELQQKSSCIKFLKWNLRISSYSS